MTMKNNVLEAHGLSKKFGATVALQDLNLTVAAGEIVCLLGANGAGKTTTINLFLGFLEPDSGSAFVNGVRVHSSAIESRKHLAYIPESVALYTKLSGLENLTFFDRLAGNRRSASELADLLIAADLPVEAHERRSSTYSKGMRQKVGVAIAMARQARALLLDEPLSGLDPAAANSFCRQIERMRDGGCGVLMATHDIFRAKEVGSRIGIMMHGQLVDLLDAAKLDAREIEHIYLQHMKDASGAAREEAA